VRNAIERDYIGALKRGEPINLADLVKQFENQLIETALQATEGKIMRAAHLLGIKRTTLSAKLHGHRRER
jgi:DNA-binding NtrC family response regulator